MSEELFNLRSQLSFYKYYHSDRINVLIHSIFVPIILFSGCAILHHIKLYKAVTLTHLMSVLYGSFYCLLYLPTGLLASSLLLMINLCLDKNWVQISITESLGLFALGWVVQFIGHGFFEHKKPAVLDNLVQSLVLAPYFILFEFLFKLGFFETLNKQLEDDIDKMRA
ncbi:hypothetical protein KAFR_0C02100 [Kazachstania africana CBS 2517]|uniref:DUF962 domain protein n=1 Tax=Kazachstania africana (strain ATCC 22294 / BCRC 22015 / CBS 2517 / CECT 1963 / NBRC 1671 / NRRL Y-8276) TaxID=1071382 RepID=H2AS53_KAZAF|nr:hypothetical protein KAFR_0C02100 [Kazachstania africana CBS 2517]CCF57203.1 hypothetical protein KAFR_0C02100 [Kazachstania africana CBS 2517]